MLQLLHPSLLRGWVVMQACGHWSTSPLDLACNDFFFCHGTCIRLLVHSPLDLACNAMHCPAARSAGVWGYWSTDGLGLFEYMLLVRAPARLPGCCVAIGLWSCCVAAGESCCGFVLVSSCF